METTRLILQEETNKPISNISNETQNIEKREQELKTVTDKISEVKGETDLSSKDIDSLFTIDKIIDERDSKDEEAKIIITPKGDVDISNISSLEDAGDIASIDIDTLENIADQQPENYGFLNTRQKIVIFLLIMISIAGVTGLSIMAILAKYNDMNKKEKENIQSIINKVDDK